MKKDYKKKLIEEFRNNVFCRRESNQRKAKKLWEEVKKELSNSDITMFQIEWNHYMLGNSELDTKGFSTFFDLYVKKYYL